MITKEMIRKGFEQNIISIQDECFGCIDICCKIGDNAFYFIEIEDENLTVEEYWKLYTMDTTVDVLYEILKDAESAEDSGLDIGEWEYYRAILL